MKRRNILGMQVNQITINDALIQCLSWSKEQSSRYICAANVHMCMEAFDKSDFRSIVNNADLVVPDGRPLVWAQHLLGADEAKQLRGMDLMLALCKQAEKSAATVGFYGATPELLDRLTNKLTQQYSDLKITCTIAPPFRALSPEEDNAIIEQINTSGVNFLFVGLGCPKQERWMAEHKNKLHCVMLGVGAAFDFIAGNKPHAPRWIQSFGLEWLFRLSCEPRRLWPRYLIQNPRFVWHFLWQWLRRK